MTTKIEWCEETWNPVTGCTPISEGCANCYAKRMAQRLKGRFGYPKDEPFRVISHHDKLDQPLKWKKPRIVFVCSMGDLFHKDVSYGAIRDIFDVIELCSWHTFLVLTKRPLRMGHSVKTWFADILPQNLWLGITAENQQTADERIPILLQIPAAKHFVSLEPLLGPVDLYSTTIGDPLCHCSGCMTMTPNRIDWVIAGCESGPGRRPAKIESFRDLKNQCVEADVDFFLKQMEIEGKVVKMPHLDGKQWAERP